MSAKTKAVLLGILAMIITAAGVAKSLLSGVSVDWSAVIPTIMAAWAAMHATNAGPTQPGA